MVHRGASMRLPALLLMVMSCATLAFAAERPRVLVLKSQELAPYAQVVAGFTAEVDAEVLVLALPASPEATERLLEKAAKWKPAMVLALGPTAATQARRRLGGVPTVFAMVPYYEKYGLEGPKVTGISLTGDFAAELATLEALFPKVKRVGVLHDPRVSDETIAELKTLVGGTGLALAPLTLENPARLEAVLKSAARKVDALLMIADKTVSNAAIVKRLIQFSADERIPLIALSSSQVKEGATLSLAASHVGIGQQAGRLANRIVHEKVDPGALAVARPETLDLSVNLQNLNSLGQGDSLALELMRFAARQGYPLKVYP